MIGIAINENAIISKVEKGEGRKSLIITFVEVVEKELSFFERSQSDEVQNITSGEASVRLWQFKVPTFKRKKKGEPDRDLTVDEKLEMIEKDLISTKNKLKHILMRYMPGPDVKWNAYAGLDVNNDNYKEKWLDDNVLLEMFSNICDQFTAYVSPFIGDKTLLSRIKLVRQDAAKPFPNLPDGNFLDTNPFFESMEVPKTASKIKFSPYEIEKGLANNEVPSKTDADATEPAPPAVTESVFGKRS